VVTHQVVPHDVVLHDVAIDVRRHDALPDRVIPARDVADDRDAEPPRGVQVRHRLEALDVRDDEPGALVAHTRDEHLRRVAVR
jgi:hypothetical protein